MPQQYEIFNNVRINTIMQALQDPRLLPQDLVWNRRIPDVNAMDEEIMARFVGTPNVADIIADDAKAAVYAYGKFQYETNRIPNLKFGVSVNQAMLNQIARLQAGAGSNNDRSFFRSWETRVVNDLKTGIERRKEALKVAMLLDNFNYNRLGVQMTGVSWGMPSDLKVTPSIAWSSTSGLPITDIQTLRRLARIRYGVEFNRLTMSTTAFQYAVATTEFQNQARVLGFGFGGIPLPAMPLQSDDMLRGILERILGGITIELYDARYWSQDAAGLVTAVPYLPINAVLMTNSAFDGDSNVYDFANGDTTEGRVAALSNSPSTQGVPTGPGPIAYATLTAPDLNSPGITYWGVARGFPRRKMLQGSAVLTVGNFQDTVTVGVPFPA